MYFRIRSTLRGASENEQSRQIKREAQLLFLAEGWTIEPGQSFCSDTVYLGKQSLYLHPMNFSGVVAEKTIAEVLELLKGARTFECYHYDRYDEYFDMDDNQYDAFLETQREAIRDTFMEKLKTKRSNLYYSSWDIISTVSRHFRIRRIGKEESYEDREHKFTSTILKDLISEGFIKSAKLKNGIGYRTANAKELAALKREMAAKAVNGTPVSLLDRANDSQSSKEQHGIYLNTEYIDIDYILIDGTGRDTSKRRIFSYLTKQPRTHIEVASFLKNEFGVMTRTGRLKNCGIFSWKSDKKGITVNSMDSRSVTRGWDYIAICAQKLVDNNKYMKTLEEFVEEYDPPPQWNQYMHFSPNQRAAHAHEYAAWRERNGNMVERFVVYELPNRQGVYAVWDNEQGNCGFFEDKNGNITTFTDKSHANAYRDRLYATPDGRVTELPLIGPDTLYEPLAAENESSANGLSF